ncbi:unnamed protein product [marine sediment metagenome]|uniref:Thil AANH domain-containing protein n=1 Tax=marine sediment metagenome TaxID=412755 RepID=X1TSM2_9ZZZZ
MIAKRKKVLVALSGGVDSSIAVALLLEAGFDCTAVFMITSDQAKNAQDDARVVAGKLGIKLHILDLRQDFERILDYFCSEYRKGRTPNPCVFCNRYDFPLLPISPVCLLQILTVTTKLSLPF